MKSFNSKKNYGRPKYKKIDLLPVIEDENKVEKIKEKKREVNRGRTKVFEQWKDQNLQTRNTLKVRMCKMIEEGKECTMGDKCWFAHSKEELRKPMCWFGELCKHKDKCPYDHSSTNILPELPPSEFKDEKFIVELSDNEDEEEKNQDSNEINKLIQESPINDLSCYDEDTQAQMNAIQEFMNTYSECEYSDTSSMCETPNSIYNTSTENTPMLSPMEMTTCNSSFKESKNKRNYTAKNEQTIVIKVKSKNGTKKVILELDDDTDIDINSLISSISNTTI